MKLSSKCTSTNNLSRVKAASNIHTPVKRGNQKAVPTGTAQAKRAPRIQVGYAFACKIGFRTRSFLLVTSTFSGNSREKRTSCECQMLLKLQ